MSHAIFLTAVGLTRQNGLRASQLLRAIRNNGMIDTAAGQVDHSTTLRVMERMLLKCLPWDLANLLVKVYLQRSGEILGKKCCLFIKLFG